MTATDRTKPAWEPISQARMIADNIHKDLADADRATEPWARLHHVEVAQDRINGLKARLDTAAKELGARQ